MHKIFNGTKLVVLDVMCVILTKGSLVKKGLYPIYQDKYPYKLVKELYSKVRHNTEGDISLWQGLNEKNYTHVRENFLDKYGIDQEYEVFKKRVMGKGIELGLLSNLPKEWAEYIQKKFKLDNDYLFTIFSGYVGLKKPDLEIYEYLLQQTNHNPNEIVFIDDKLKNLEPASRLGIKTVHFKREDDEFEFEADTTIKSFLDLF